MAIVQNPITGRTKKAFGSAVFAKQYGKNTMRTKPLEVKNPKTLKQKMQRSKFSLMVAIGTPFVQSDFAFSKAAIMELLNAVFAASILDWRKFFRF